MSPEFIVTTAATQLQESAETVHAVGKPLIIPFLRALTWALDSSIQGSDVLRPFSPITAQLRQTAWKGSNMYGK